MSKFHHLHQLLSDLGLIQKNNLFRPGQVKTETLQLTHDENYISRFKNNQLSTKEMRKMGLPWSEALVKRSLISPNGTLMAGSIALNHGIACHMAGGTHHAYYDHGRGYCIFNDLAVAANSLVAQGKVKKILIFDCDVHQGDGTATLFQNNPSVFTCSIHCEKNFPHHKAVSDLDVGLPRNMSDEAYLKVVHDTLVKAINIAQPELIFYDAGVDVFQYDDLGYLNISFAGLQQREQLVLKTIKAQNIPVATVIGGGYDKDKIALARRHALIFQAAAELYG